jgi:hypothetical protein
VQNYTSAYRKALGHLTRDIEIEAIGVFDTVGALGVPIHPLIWKAFPWIPTFLKSEHRFYDTSLGNHVKHAFHALALDEHRAAFSPAVWEKPPGCNTNLEQVWFSGVHTNIGGGYRDTATANITLAWMMEKLRPFVRFSDTYLRDAVIANQTFYKTQPMEDSQANTSFTNPTWGWGIGLLYNSNRLPTRLAGSLNRTPLLYQQTRYETGQSTGELLRNTGEMIHPSVRARKQFGGRDWRGGPYQSQALKDWILKGKTWVYTGHDAHGFDHSNQPREIHESGLSGYELEILEYDLEMRAKLLS